MVKKFTKDRILNLLQKFPYGISRKKIAEQLGLNVSTMAYHWNKLLKQDRIKKIGWCLFTLGEKFSVEPTMNIHALQLSFPILKDESTPDFWDKAVPMPQGWTAYYKYIQAPIGMTIQKNVKQVTIHVWARDIQKPEEIESLALRAAFYAWHYLKEKVKVEVDVFLVEKKTLELAIKDNNLKQIIGTKDKIEIALQRPAKAVFESDKPKEAKAWYDPTPVHSVETNDIEYAERYLRTPEMVREILDIQHGFSKNLESHLEVLKNINEGIRELRNAIKTLNQYKQGKTNN